MQRIQLTKDHNGRLKGQVFNVDEDSAKALIGAKVAQKYDGKGEVTPRTLKPGAVNVAVVADADYPSSPAKGKDEAGSDSPAASASPKASAK